MPPSARAPPPARAAPPRRRAAGARRATPPRARPPGAARPTGRRRAPPARPPRPRPRRPAPRAGRPPTTSTTSPRTSRAAKAAAASPSVPAPDLLVQLGQLAHHGDRPRRVGGRPARPAWPPPGPAPRGRTVVRSSAMSAATRRRRSGPLRGRKPSTQNRSVGSPLTTSAPSTDDGPGHGAHRLAGGGQLRRQPGARVRDPGRAGVADDGHRRARRPRAAATRSSRAASLCPCSDSRRSPRGPLAGCRRRQQGPGAPGVLAADQVGRRQHLARPGREVAQVPDRRGHQHEPAPPLLAHGRAARCTVRRPRAPRAGRPPARPSARATRPRSATALRAVRPAQGHPPRLEPGHPHHGEVGREKGHVDGEFHAGGVHRAGAVDVQRTLAARCARAARRARPASRPARAHTPHRRPAAAIRTASARGYRTACRIPSRLSASCRSERSSASSGRRRRPTTARSRTAAAADATLTAPA